MKALLFVFIGGGLGSASRFAINLLASSQGLTRFPWATLTVNATGGLVIGILGALLWGKPSDHPLRLLLITGFLGGFTTFSAFSLETLQQFLSGQTKQALLNIVANNGLALALVALGFALTRWLSTAFHT